MNSLNSILLEGNLTRDPVLKQTPKGTPVCEFALASNRFYRQDEELQKEVSFFEVESWGKVAERCGTELTKGRGVRVIGRLKQNRWVNGEGENRSKVLVVAEHVEFKPQFSKQRDEAVENEAEEIKDEIESDDKLKIDDEVLALV